ncbi:MAG: bacillithiol biosynthesis deacetylase BshB1 [Vicinamibacterales bacterium]
MALDLLVFGPHPDDLEIGLAGTIAKHASMGLAVGLCDLTAGELGTNGAPDDRRREAARAADLLGARWRENLGWPDGAIEPAPDRLRAVVDLLRRHQPRVVALPYWQDRHPDHVDASRVLDLAVFRSGLRRVVTDADPWRPEWTCYYFINTSVPPSFVVDVSAHYDTKRAALDCHQSQFAPGGEDPAPTRLTHTTFRQLIESRDAQFGAQAGVAFAEGLVVREPVVRPTLFRSTP